VINPQAAAVLTRRHQVALANLAERNMATMLRAWVSTGDDESDVDAFMRASATPWDAMTRGAFTLSGAFYSMLLARAAPPMTVGDLEVPDERREPFIALWRALAAGRGPEQAEVAARRRLEAIVRNRVVSTARRTGDVFVARGRVPVAHWRRVLDGGACDWCQLVAGQRYKTATAADFGHDRCGCTPVPVTA
jgi:hypothetical protein